MLSRSFGLALPVLLICLSCGSGAGDNDADSTTVPATTDTGWITPSDTSAPVLDSVARDTLTGRDTGRTR